MGGSGSGDSAHRVLQRRRRVLGGLGSSQRRRARPRRGRRDDGERFSKQQRIAGRYRDGTTTNCGGSHPHHLPDHRQAGRDRSVDDRRAVWRYSTRPTRADDIIGSRCADQAARRRPNAEHLPNALHSANRRITNAHGHRRDSPVAAHRQGRRRTRLRQLPRRHGRSRVSTFGSASEPTTRASVIWPASILTAAAIRSRRSTTRPPLPKHEQRSAG